MKLGPVKISEATREQLKLFAELSLGLEVPKTANADHIRKLIAEQHVGEEITVPISAAEDDQAAPVEAADDAPGPQTVVAAAPAPIGDLDEAAVLDRLDTDSRSDPKITIQIHNQAGKGGERPVFVNVNGVSILLPRNRPITIPYRNYLALQDAMGTDWEQVYDAGEREEVMVQRDMHSYPFTVIQSPSKAEVDAWTKAKADRQRAAVAQRRAREQAA